MATSTGEPAEQTSPDNPAPGPRVPGPPGRPPRPHRLRLLDPLRQRDFGLLWVGMTASLIGDGLYFVAIAWQVLDLSDRPSALSIVGVAWTVPQLLFLLIGGVLTDRLDRRTVLIGSDVVRGVAIGVLGVLSIAGTLVLWHVVVLVAIYGAAEAFFMPAFGAIVPDLVPSDMLVQANSLDQFVRPVALRLVGPALGGLVIAGLGVGWAFIFDAASF
ncbi:MAG TPA: MFS transporter, partial [Actinomycetota bacterium]|nr:MFS transporter [Actinomycetota bacterium]